MPAERIRDGGAMPSTAPYGGAWEEVGLENASRIQFICSVVSVSESG